MSSRPGFVDDSRRLPVSKEAPESDSSTRLRQQWPDQELLIRVDGHFYRGTLFWIPVQTVDEWRIPPSFVLGSADSNRVDPKAICSEDVGEKAVSHHHCLLGRGIELLYQL